jgi:FixJ family two-component response regulator
MNATGGRALVTVIDDDESVREALPDLLGELGFSAEVFVSADAFLASGKVEQAQCLLVDVAMPGMTGPELQQELGRRGIAKPIVFITAYSDERLHAQLVDRGAVDCLLKPFSATALLVAVRRALSLDTLRHGASPPSGA